MDHCLLAISASLPHRRRKFDTEREGEEGSSLHRPKRRACRCRVLAERRQELLVPFTGWTAPTGTSTRTTFATASVTLPVLAEHVKALIDDLTALGIIWG